MFKFITQHKIVFGIIVIVLGVGGYYLYKSYNTTSAQTSYVLAAAEKGTITTSVSGSGQISASNQIDIKSKAAGTIISVNVKNGQSVKSGTILAQIDSRDAQKTVSDAQSSLENAKISLAKLEINTNDTKNAVRDAQANLENAKLSLEKIKRGSLPEDINTAQIKVDNAKANLANAQKDLETTKTKAKADLDQLYVSAVSAASSALTKGKSTMLTITNIQYAHFLTKDQDGINLANAKADALKILIGADDAGFWNTESIGKVDNGLKNVIEKAELDPSYDNVIDALSQTKTALQKIRTTLDYIPLNVQMTSGEISSVSSEKSSIDSSIDSITTKISGIDNQRLTNQTNISSAQTKIDDANTNLVSAQNDLKVKQDGNDPLDIKAQELAVQQKENALADAQAKLQSGYDSLDIQSQQLAVNQQQNAVNDAMKKLADYSITAPADGTIATISIQVGDTVASNASAATFISQQRIAVISLNEVDVAKVKVGQKSTLTFDALPDLTISGQVAEIDTIGTVSQGVVSYSIKISFDTQDDRVKPGMSVSASIITDSKVDVIVVSNAAIKSNTNGGSYVEILEGDNSAVAQSSNNGVVSPTSPVQKIITTGLSNDTSTEIISGLKEGEMVVTRTITSSSTTSSTTTGSSLFSFGPNSSSNKSSSSSSGKSNSTGSGNSGDAGGPPPF